MILFQLFLPYKSGSRLSIFELDVVCGSRV
jgi:hypothetical protein